MSGKRNDIELIEDDELIELADDGDHDGPTMITPRPQQQELRRHTAPQASLERPRATATHRKPTRPLFTTESAQLPEAPRPSRQRAVPHPAVSAPYPDPYQQTVPAPAAPVQAHYPQHYQQPAQQPYPEPYQYQAPVQAPYPQHYQEFAEQPQWEGEPQQHAPVPWAGQHTPIDPSTWQPEQAPQPPMASSGRSRVALHPAALFGMVVAALAVGVGLAVVLLKPGAPEPRAIEMPAQPVMPAPVTTPLPTPRIAAPAPTPTATALPRPTAAEAVPTMLDTPTAPIRPGAGTSSGVRTRAPAPGAAAQDNLADTVAARLAAAQPEMAGAKKVAEKPAGTAKKAEASDELDAIAAQPEKKPARAKSADPFAEEDAPPAESKPAKKAGKKWEDPFANDQ